MHIRIHSECWLSCLPAHLDWLSTTFTVQRYRNRQTGPQPASPCCSLQKSAQMFTSLSPCMASFTAACSILTRVDTVLLTNCDVRVKDLYQWCVRSSATDKDRAAQLNASMNVLWINFVGCHAYSAVSYRNVVSPVWVHSPLSSQYSLILSV